MVIRVGINGFGRIGRIVFRTCAENNDIEVSAINDPAINAEYICYLIKYDSTHGTFEGNICHTETDITFRDKKIQVYNSKQPSSIPWQKCGVQYVIEASGMFTSNERAASHMSNGTIKRVIVTSPSADIPMIVVGVNEDDMLAGPKIISSASSTLYCLAPVMKLLEESFGVWEGCITSIHAMTPSLKPLDGLCIRGKHWRDNRSIHQNIIPATTGACKALGKIIPSMKDKLCGTAFRVPIVNVSVLDITVRLLKKTTLQEIFATVEKGCQTSLKGIIKICTDQAVSSDFINETHSCILDKSSCMQLNPNFFKLICFYENEYSYACRVVDTIRLCEKHQANIPRIFNTPKRVCECGDCNKIAAINDENNVIVTTSYDTALKNSLCTPKILPCARKQAPTKSNEFKPGNMSMKNNAHIHSCEDFEAGNKEFECKTQERLQKVKREFNKMVSLTETLLKKSESSKSRTLNVQNIPIKEEVVINYNLIDTKITNKEVKQQINNENNVIVDDKNVTKVEDTKSNELVVSLQNLDAIHSIHSQRTELNNLALTIQIEAKNGSYSVKAEPKSYGDCSRDELPITKDNDVIKILIDETSEDELPEVIVPHYSEENDKSRIKSIKESLFQQCVKDLKCVSDKYNVYDKKIVNDTNVSDSSNKYKENKPPSKALKRSLIPVKLNVDKKVKDKEICKVSDYTCAHIGDIIRKFSPLNRIAQKYKKTNPIVEEDYMKYTEDPPIYTNDEGVRIYEEIAPIQDNHKQASDTIILGCDGSTSVIKDDEKSFRNTEDSISDVSNLSIINRMANATESENDKTPKTQMYSEDCDETQSQDDANDSIQSDTDNETIKESSINSVSATTLPDGNCFDSYKVDNSCSIKTFVSLPQSSICRTKSPQPYEGKRTKFKVDIYDKLDSESEDSDDSHKIKGKKSQVISITDITSSLEDFERLGRICKIIEISDELSEQLFAPLSDAKGELCKKQWSFKDLCDKIKLDEFCRSVFGSKT